MTDQPKRPTPRTNKRVFDLGADGMVDGDFARVKEGK